MEPSALAGIERMQLVGSALAGRTIDVVSAAAGELSWTDGQTVFLADADPAEWLAALAVQASLIAHGGLDADVLRSLGRRPTTARRYLAVEGHRALSANRALLPARVRVLIDDELVVGLMDPWESLVRSREPRDLPETPGYFGTIHARRVLAAFDRGPGAAAQVPGHSPRSSTGDLLDLEEELDDGDDGRDVGDLLSSPVGGGGPIGQLLKRLLEPVRRRSGGGPPGADAPTHRGNARPGQGGVTATMSGPTEDRTAVTPATRETGTPYPEWDVHRGGYRDAWCTVIEVDAPADAASPPAIADPLGLRRPLARLGVGLTRQRRQLHGDDVDVDALVDTLVEQAAGRAGDGAVYVENQRRRRDLSVLVLLDVSGSAGEPGTSGVSVHEHQRTTAGALLTSLHELGDRVALYAFNSRGRTAVQLARVKDFDDPLDGATARRLHGLTPGGFTRLGAAVRHGTTILDERGGTHRRLLVAVSDGFAYDHGYEGRYGEADARRALLEARRRGVGCVCLSVGTTTGTTELRRVFGTAAHATVPRPDQLPALVAPLFQQAMRRAEAQRRAFQRTERHEHRVEIDRRTHDGNGQAVLQTGR